MTSRMQFTQFHRPSIARHAVIHPNANLQRRSLTTANGGSGGRGSGVAIAGLLFLTAAGVAYYNYAKEDREFYGQEDPRDAARKASQRIEHRADVVKDSLKDDLQDARRSSAHALEDVRAAKDNLAHSASDLGHAAQQAYGGMRNTAEKEGQRLVDTIKDETHHVVDSAKTNAAHVRDKLDRDVQEIKSETERFRVEHHMKDGNRPSEDVLADTRDYVPGRTGGIPIRSGKRPEGDEAGPRREGTRPGWFSFGRGAKEMADDAAEKSVHDMKEADAYWQKTKQSAKEKAEDAEKSAKRTWSGVKEQAHETAEEAKERLRQDANRAESYWQSGKDKVKDETERLSREASDRARAAGDKAKHEAEKAESSWFNFKSEAKDTADDAANRAKQEAKNVESSWENLKQNVGNEANQLKNKVYETTEDVTGRLKQEKDRLEDRWDATKQDAEQWAGSKKREVEGYWNDGMRATRTEADEARKDANQAKQWFREGAQNVEMKADKLLGNRHDRSVNMQDHVRRGEGWAEEEADNLRPTRPGATSTGRATGHRDNAHYRPAEVVVSEARA
ncbi:uncharacterized protein BYT42DRAFT_608213 [Radiomyces spectabilis]|uniref:uncharacterized protein n=1 Tax=Radiomyces spectabilis TaxID=64574 RepID=UPI00221F0859|nr:uncharacterized protein BYT42DRAFT_608213 [Radiomyces spectabilis]KAI8367501.1 hypothetical protein BYT42DRAFT_608213 [Radiomyces spectabilis]